MTILIVEDDPGMAHLMERYLQPVSKEIRVAENIPLALELMRKVPPPDIVLLDLRLPGSSAENTLEHIRELKEVNPKALVVVVTGMHDEALPLMAAQRGADAFTEKFEVDTQNKLLEYVRGALTKRRESGQPVFENSLRILETLTGLLTQK